MRRLTLLWLLIILIALLLTAHAAGARSSAPEVFKVDPPDWWPGHSINPARLLIRGRNLNGARVEAVGAGLTIGAVSANASGTYLFVDILIDRQAAPGRRALRITTTGGTTEAPFELLPPLARRGRFQGFTPDDVMYLIMVDRFCDGDPANNDTAATRKLYSRANPRGYHGGDLQGIINRLPYLQDLGVTAIWTTPVYDNVNLARDYSWGKNVTDYHGYGAVDFYAVEDHFGALAKYKELVDRAHALGLKVIQDQVANHIGPEHPWAADPPTPTWLNGTKQKHLNNVFDIKAITEERPDPARYEATLRGWFGDFLPDPNQDDPETARYLIQNALWWVNHTGLDAIRQDTLPFAPRRFWSDWNRALDAEFGNFIALGEVFDARPEVTAFFQGGRARFDGVDTHLDTVFDFPSYFAIRDVFIRDKPASRLTEVLAADRLYPDPRLLVTFLGNHDVPRFMSEAGATPERLKLAFTYLLTMRGTPQLYYGDEIGMEGKEDPDNRRDFPGGFPGDPRNAFTTAGRAATEQDIFNHVRRLLRLRAGYAALRGGGMRVLAATDTTLAYLRESGRDRVLVAINNSDQRATLEIPMPDAAAKVWVDALRGGKRVRVTGGRMTLSLEARAATVLVEKK